jgi:hypothetical protein
MASGERRLRIDGTVSPRLADAARTAMACIAAERPTLVPVRLDLVEGRAEAQAVSPARASAVCLSGGVDALAALDERRRDTDAPQDTRFGYGIFAFGFNSYDFRDGQPVPERLQAADTHAARLATLAEREQLTLLRVWTNLRALHESFESMAAVTHDSHLAAIGHLMRPAIRSLTIGSAGAGIARGLTQDALLVALYATDDLDVHGGQPMMTRLEKLRRILEWPDAVRVLRVCLLIDLPEQGARNCGVCEKCVRTMLQCIALGRSKDPLVQEAFPHWDRLTANVARVHIARPHVRDYYLALVERLRREGRADLSDAVVRALQ